MFQVILYQDRITVIENFNFLWCSFMLYKQKIKNKNKETNRKTHTHKTHHNYNLHLFVHLHLSHYISWPDLSQMVTLKRPLDVFHDSPVLPV